MTTATAPTSSGKLMQCMEVWGGNEVARAAVTMEGLDAWVYCEPFDGSDAGGDIYYVSSCATNRILRLLIADVSGHGGDVKEPALMLRGLMRKYVNHLDQERFVRSMNRQFTELAADGLFATAVVSTFFPPTGRLTLCNAGHPYPLLYRKKSGTWELLMAKEETAPQRPHRVERRTLSGLPTPTNLPLGILDRVDYQTFDVTLELGDVVICYTDSLTEARGADGIMLGHAGLLTLANTLCVGDPDLLISELLIAIRQTMQGAPMSDDVTLLVFRPNTQARRRLPIGRQLRAGALVIKSMARGLIGRGPMALPDCRLANLGGLLFPSLQKRWRSRAAIKPVQ